MVGDYCQKVHYYTDILGIHDREHDSVSDKLIELIANCHQC